MRPSGLPWSVPTVDAICRGTLLLIALAALGGQAMPVAAQDVRAAPCCVPAGPAEEVGPADLGSVLTPIRDKHDLPALAAAVIRDGRLAALGAIGVRKAESGVAVTAADQFHLGSCSKAMTATLIGLLVQQGKLDWDTRLDQVYPELSGEMHADYRGVTVRHLLSHRAGLPATVPEGTSLLQLHLLSGSIRAQREAYVRMLLRGAPLARPGEKYLYSNAGYAIAGAMAERVTDRSWEELMRETLFRPLEITSAGFGSMGTPGNIDQPWQHVASADGPKPVPPGRLSDNPPVLGPAGRVHCALADWCRFVVEHLRAVRGEANLLEPETAKVLHTPAFAGDYAGGWLVAKRQWAKGRVLTHAGSNTMNYAVVWMAPRRDAAVLVATNQGGDAARKACDETATALIRTHLP